MGQQAARIVNLDPGEICKENCPFGRDCVGKLENRKSSFSCNREELLKYDAAKLNTVIK